MVVCSIGLEDTLSCFFKWGFIMLTCAIPVGRDAMVLGKLMYAPPKDWTVSQRRALSNSLLVEYDNTWDAWFYQQKGQKDSGLIFNIDAMLQATTLSDSGPGYWNYADMLQICSYGKGRTPGGGMTLSEYRVHYAVWSILASPLVIGTDLWTIEQQHPDCLALLKNKDIIGVNQDKVRGSSMALSRRPSFFVFFLCLNRKDRGGGCRPYPHCPQPPPM